MRRQKSQVSMCPISLRRSPPNSLDLYVFYSFSLHPAEDIACILPYAGFEVFALDAHSNV